MFETETSWEKRRTWSSSEEKDKRDGSVASEDIVGIGLWRSSIRKSCRRGKVYKAGSFHRVHGTPHHKISTTGYHQ
jgi:hypothetical protein